MQPKRCSKIISACFLLHNFARERNLPHPDFEDIPAEENDASPADNSQANASQSGLAIRNALALRFVS